MRPFAIPVVRGDTILENGSDAGYVFKSHRTRESSRCYYCEAPGRWVASLLGLRLCVVRTEKSQRKCWQLAQRNDSSGLAAHAPYFKTSDVRLPTSKTRSNLAAIGRTARVQNF